MRRDDLRLEVSNVAWLEAGEPPRQPCLEILAEVDPGTVRERLEGAPAAPLGAADVDVTFRYLGESSAADAPGVLAFADRVTGEFLLEVDADGGDVMDFVRAARRYAERTEETARYRGRVVAAGEPVFEFEKQTLLVYSGVGELLRQHSLIPGGVEI